MMGYFLSLPITHPLPPPLLLSVSWYFFFRQQKRTPCQSILVQLSVINFFQNIRCVWRMPLSGKASAMLALGHPEPLLLCVCACACACACDVSSEYPSCGRSLFQCIPHSINVLCEFQMGSSYHLFPVSLCFIAKEDGLIALRVHQNFLSATFPSHHTKVAKKH